MAQVAHATSSGGLSALALDAPVVGAELGRGVAALSASLLLVVEGTTTAATAESVRLGVALTKRRGTLGLLRREEKKKKKNRVGQSLNLMVFFHVRVSFLDRS